MMLLRIPLRSLGHGDYPERGMADFRIFHLNLDEQLTAGVPLIITGKVD